MKPEVGAISHTWDQTPLLRVVAIGGGTGLSALLKGLKRYAPGHGRRPDFWPGAGIGITAIVTVTDDGGSSGRLRREFDILPPGDIRNCMVALSEDEALLSQLFQYRFPSGRGLKGHSFGNLFLAALTRVTGDFAQAVKVSSEVLASYGRIYPSTAADVVLRAKLENGAEVEGESRISRSKVRIKKISLKPRRCRPVDETLEAIAAADLITMGPGSLFTSLIPNVLVEGVSEAIAASPAVKAYFVNLMWQPGETIQFTAADHVAAIYQHARRPLFDYAIVNTEAISAAQMQRYAEQRQCPVAVDHDRLEALGIKVLSADLVGDEEKIRHDPNVAAAIAVRLAIEGRKRRAALAGAGK